MSVWEMQSKRRTDENASLLSVRDAAKRLRVHRNTVYRLIRSGTLPASKQKGQWLVSTDDVYRYSSGQYPWLTNLGLVRQSLDGIRRLLESTKLPMGITDVEGFFLGVNDAYQDVLGYSRRWFFTHTYLDYAAEETCHGNESNRLRAVSKHGISVAYRKKAVTSTGGIVHIDFQVVAVPIDPDPASTQVICLATNIEHE